MIRIIRFIILGMIIFPAAFLIIGLLFEATMSHYGLLDRIRDKIKWMKQEHIKAKARRENEFIGFNSRHIALVQRATNRKALEQWIKQKQVRHKVSLEFVDGRVNQIYLRYDNTNYLANVHFKADANGDLYVSSVVAIDPALGIETRRFSGYQFPKAKS